jgi:hypothetical protein
MPKHVLRLCAPYIPREIRCLELWQHEEWTFKLYNIRHAKRETPSESALKHVKSTVRTRLHEVEDRFPHYGLGFIIFHQGEDGNYILMNAWTDECILVQHLYVAPLHAPGHYEYHTPTGMMACVWELEVHCFERDAWVSTMMGNTPPDASAYLESRLLVQG